MKSKMIQHLLHINYEETFAREDLVSYIVNNYSNLDSELSSIV